MFEIMFSDLNKDAQERFLEYMGIDDPSEGNYEIVPIAEIDYNDDDDNGETDIDRLDAAIKKKVGDTYWLETEDDSDNPVIEIQVYEVFAKDVQKILKDFGYEILECTWFSGSSYDGYTFTVKKGE